MLYMYVKCAGNFRSYVPAYFTDGITETLKMEE